MKPFDPAKVKSGDSLYHVHLGPCYYIGMTRRGKVSVERSSVGIYDITSPELLELWEERRKEKIFRVYWTSPDPRIQALERRK